MKLRLIPDFNRYINSQKKGMQGIPPLKWRKDNGLAESELELADEFNGQFTDVIIKNEHKQVPFPYRSASFIEDIHVSAGGVTKLLKDLNPSKGLRPVELHPRVLKGPESELGQLFTPSSNNLLTRVKSPKEWSLANVYPSTKRRLVFGLYLLTSFSNLCTMQIT